MELKANELRVGNYLNTIHGIKRVSDISVDRYCWFTDNQCEPIPLTEEWLLKFGFGKSDEHELGHNLNDNFGFYYDYHFKKFRLETSDNDGLNYADVILNIESVHQLQNLYFALTNEELEIKM